MSTPSDRPGSRVPADDAVARVLDTSMNRRTPRQSVTLRLPLALVHVLRRAAAERSLEYAEPFTQQAIVESALLEWLRSAGYDRPAEAA